MSTMRPSRSNTFIVFLPLLFADAKVYFLLQNKAPKCFQVSAPSFVKLMVKYDAPVKDDGSVDAGGNTIDPSDGLDAKFNQRFQKRIDTLKRANLKDIHISITPRDALGGVIVDRKNFPNSSEQVPEKIREAIEQRSGVMEYETKNLSDGMVEFCVQSYTASAETPSRISLVVEQESEQVVIERQIEQERRELSKSLADENKLVKEETSRITAELIRMHRRSRSIAADSQYSRDREEHFQNQSIALNRAVRYWPIFRMTILLIAGYFQVSNVVGYMKKKHIC